MTDQVEPAPGTVPLPGEWAEEAACQGLPTEWWYPSRDIDWNLSRLRERMQGTVAALHICRDLCPVRVQCLAHALRHREVGIWGGLEEKDRRKLLRVSRRKRSVA